MEVSAGEILQVGQSQSGSMGPPSASKFFVADIDSFVLVITFKAILPVFIVTRPV